MDLPDFGDYVKGIREKHTKKGVVKLPMKTEVIERWNSRILPRNLHKQGAPGAEVYLRDYGRGISTQKVEALALYAEGQGDEKFALGFWARGYELAYKKKPSVSECDGQAGETGASEGTTYEKTTNLNEPAPVNFPSLPPHLQPGRIVTMQPVDAERNVEFYLENTCFLAQPKRDGERLVVGVEADGTALAQKRSGRVVSVSPEWLPAIQKVTKEYGAFVLDGERYFADADGKEHRTGSQAATANMKNGKPDGEVVERYAVFKALFVGDLDLTQQMEIRRIEFGTILARELTGIDPGIFDALTTCSTLQTKTALLEAQKTEGREGVVFVRRDCLYTGGKTKGLDAPFVRNKFLHSLEVIVTKLTETGADGRAFGAIEVGAFCNGELKALGSVGTGFTQEEMRVLAMLHAANPGGVVIEVCTQGFTENGKLWQPRYVDLRPEKTPQECEVAL